MSILTEFRTAAENYARDNITTSVSPPEPDEEGVISQNEEFSFDLVATNAGDPDGIAVTNVSYHLEAEGAGIQLIVPPETVAIARSGRLQTSSQLTPGSLVTSMFLFGIKRQGWGAHRRGPADPAYPWRSGLREAVPR
jgi:hypothetical protein